MKNPVQIISNPNKATVKKNAFWPGLYLPVSGT
jgi:hypothetical protein